MTELFLAQQAALAEAAKEFVESRREYNLARDEENYRRHLLADEHMCWLVNTIAHDWHPDEFVSELE